MYTWGLCSSLEIQFCFRNVFETYQNLLHTQLSPILPDDPNITKIFNNYAIVQINKDKRYVKDHV
jgi:hypothetical protein